MIRTERLTFTYPGGREPSIRDVTLEVADGEFLLVAGASGSGKSTLLRALCGLVPHHSGGTLSGTLHMAGRDMTGEHPSAFAATVGFVPQDPEAHTTSDRVMTELAFTMENLGIQRPHMRRRIEEALDQLSIAHLRDRSLDTLSGGERQRVAIAAVLTAQPQILICDEPTSALDPAAAEEVFASLVRLRDELGLTIVCSEHRLERVAAFCDRVAFVTDAAVVSGPPRDVFAASSFAPPVTEIGRALHLEPLPLTVRDGRNLLDGRRFVPPVRPPRALVDRLVSCSGLAAARGDHPVLTDVSFDLHRGEVAAVVGRNGSGKTTLLRVLAGLTEATGGTVEVAGVEHLGTPDAFARIAYIPQRAEMLLFRDTVREELEASSPSHVGVETWTQRCGLGPLLDRHPWTLSAGQRLWAALATAFANRADLYLLDEPTRGLDPPGKDRLADICRTQADNGAGVLLVTHDVELIARVCDTAHVLANGELVASGSVADVLGESVLFSSQTTKVMRDPRFLTPRDVT